MLPRPRFPKLEWMGFYQVNSGEGLHMCALHVLVSEDSVALTSYSLKASSYEPCSTLKYRARVNRMRKYSVSLETPLYSSRLGISSDYTTAAESSSL